MNGFERKELIQWNTYRCVLSGRTVLIIEKDPGPDPRVKGKAWNHIKGMYETFEVVDHQLE